MTVALTEPTTSKRGSKAQSTPDKTVQIPPPKFITALFKIRGTSPYVQNKFSAKAREMMKAKQEAGSQAKKGKQREAKDFKACYEAACHVADDGWYGIPAPAFRSGLISACRLVNFKMTLAKLSVFIVADGFDRDPNERAPLVKITKGKPRYTEMLVKNETGVADIRARPMWDEGWEAELRIRFDGDQFTVADVANLLRRVGEQVGIGEGRPDSKNSHGMGWGTFEVVGNK